MPCNDVTETLDIKFNHDYSISDYSIKKRTCGAQVGQQSLIKDWACTQTPNQFLAMSQAEFLELPEIIIGQDQFIYLKHFEALQQALLILKGEVSSTKHDSMRLAQLDHNEDCINMRLYISVPIDPSGNPGCGDGGCGSGSGGGCGSSNGCGSK